MISRPQGTPRVECEGGPELDHSLVFVGGLHRSGTTPLAKALASHPQVSGLTGTVVSEDEGQHLQDVYPRIRVYGGMGRFANAAAAHLTEASPLASAASAQRLLAAWSPYWDLERPYLVEKSPSNLIMTRFLHAMFPDARFVMVMRHPIVVALAMQKWNPRIIARNGRRHVTLPGLVAHWIRAHELLREDASRVGGVHVLRYEDLTADPGAELARIADHLGLESPIPGGSIRPGLSRGYEEEWEAMRTGNPFRRRQRRTIEETFGAAIARYGYDVRDLARPLENWSFRTV